MLWKTYVMTELCKDSIYVVFTQFRRYIILSYSLSPPVSSRQIKGFNNKTKGDGKLKDVVENKCNDKQQVCISHQTMPKLSKATNLLLVTRLANTKQKHFKHFKNGGFFTFNIRPEQFKCNIY